MMTNKIYFSERQKFNQWWIWLILLIVNSVSLFTISKQMISPRTFGETSMSKAQFILVEVTVVLVSILILCIRLDTQIGTDGISVKFFPFHLSFRHYAWKDISRSFVREYNPIGDFGGWGLRISIFGKGKAFTVSGNKGLQLQFSDDKNLLIGTSKPNELMETLTQIGQLKP
jgi:hypothetical protein